MQTVVAGLIWNEGKLLIGQRSDSGSHPLFWEFPGGKVEPRESECEALVRELAEELSITAMLGHEFTRYRFSYPGRPPILLVFITIESYTGDPVNSGLFAAIAWENPANFDQYRFLDGDLPLIQLLSEIKVDQVE